jgi:hypothetical protein
METLILRGCSQISAIRTTPEDALIHSEPAGSPAGVVHFDDDHGKMNEYHKPLARYRFISFLTCALLAIAFILFLLVSLSLTIIKPIYLFSFRSTAPVNQPLSIATELRFGIWGVCASR